MKSHTNWDEVSREVLKIGRERVILKAAPISEVLKRKLLGALDDRLALLEAELLVDGGVQPPNGPQKAQKGG